MLRGIWTIFYANDDKKASNIKNEKCYYISTPRPEDYVVINGHLITWDCPTGYFCPNKKDKFKCSPGFFCPENSAQPIYCCEGYYCSEDAKNIFLCPEGSFCTAGTTDPISCNFLANCPPGSIKPNKFMVSVLVLIFIMVIFVFFHYKKLADNSDKVKYYESLRRLDLVLEIDNNRTYRKRTFIRDPQRFLEMNRYFLWALRSDEEETQPRRSIARGSRIFEIDIEFENLALELPNGNLALKGVTGEFRHGRTCAVMGPSGSGKSTLLSLLTGKINKKSGVVKKERGISGGERKRVNIGMELVAEPSVLFLDEPTSGLDSNMSLEICSMLKYIAEKQNITVVAVIHSPSQQDVTFAGISAGCMTFGYEMVVYWRDTSAGMKTIPYFLAKIIIDIPRILIAALMFTLSLIVFYPFQVDYYKLYLIILLNYISAWMMGYFVSIVIPKEKFGLVGTGVALAWGLVLSGESPKLEEVDSDDSYKPLKWLWDISAQRWTVEALYLKELSSRLWDEIINEELRHTYSFDDYPKCLYYILYIALGWAILSFLALKLTNRDKHK
ncbi:hypothetical protein C2G38_2250070 [Gigaspora rosea]|uniref:ABC transporter domain-containing protein n=1 Tax=Gigaspora rosea TaxID=44941 RepID=A0A397UN53_9GLOM|nr:hypothetical protein C2G38_2250070 [Gigaspora rosea]